MCAHSVDITTLNIVISGYMKRHGFRQRPVVSCLPEVAPLFFLLTLIHSYQAPMKLSVFEPLMHVLVTDVPSALGYEWPVHYLEWRWASKMPTLQPPDWHTGCRLSRDRMEMCQMRTPHLTAPLIRWHDLTAVAFACVLTG